MTQLASMHQFMSSTVTSQSGSDVNKLTCNLQKFILCPYTKVPQHFTGRLIAALHPTPLRQAICTILLPRRKEQCCSFFLVTLSMSTEEDSNSISHILLGLPFIGVVTVFVYITSSFLESPVNFIMCDLYVYAVWA
jgi:hypothetical protein